MIQQYPSISNIYIHTLTLTEIILNGLGFLKELGYLCGTDHPICWAVQFGGRGADLWEHKIRWSQHQLPLKQSARSANWPLGDCFLVWICLDVTSIFQIEYIAEHQPTDRDLPCGSPANKSQLWPKTPSHTFKGEQYRYCPCLPPAIVDDVLFDLSILDSSAKSEHG